jgi:hypothetical protein
MGTDVKGGGPYIGDKASGRLTAVPKGRKNWSDKVR